jgi:hypothetical protein
MADCNCNLELNKQIQGLQARLSQAENNITSHFYGISMAIQGLAANPLTAGSVASVSGIYNLVPSGFQLLQNLIMELNPVDFKNYMMTMAASLMGNMAAELDTLVDTAFATLDETIAAVEATIVALEDSVASATTALNDAISGGIPEQIADAQAYLDDMNAKLAKSQQTRSNLNDVSAGGISFLTAQANIAKCKSFSLGLS